MSDKMEKVYLVGTRDEEGDWILGGFTDKEKAEEIANWSKDEYLEVWELPLNHFEEVLAYQYCFNSNGKLVDIRRTLVNKSLVNSVWRDGSYYKVCVSKDEDDPLEKAKKLLKEYLKKEYEKIIIKLGV